MSDAWEEIQAIKSKRNSLREKLQKRKKERQDILNLSGGGASGKYQLEYYWAIRYGWFITTTE